MQLWIGFRVWRISFLMLSTLQLFGWSNKRLTNVVVDGARPRFLCSEIRAELLSSISKDTSLKNSLIYLITLHKWIITIFAPKQWMWFDDFLMSINTIVMIWSHSNTVFSIQINGVIPITSLVFKAMESFKYHFCIEINVLRKLNLLIIIWLDLYGYKVL